MYEGTLAQKTLLTDIWKLKRNKRYHIDIINSFCIALREYFYAFFIATKIYRKKLLWQLKSINLEHGGKIIQSISSFSYLFE